MLTTMKEIWVLILIFNFRVFANRFICNTPDYWLGETHCELCSAPYRAMHKWPDGIVWYEFNQSLTLDDLAEVKKAFDEYHRKTCIKFEPRKDGAANFVSIEVDDNICGIANVGFRGGYQFARFGGVCKTKATMVHELGHTLGFGHEHQRVDRDNFLSFTNCTRKPRKLFPNSYTVSGMYDYASQMHYQCDSCELGGWITQPNVLKCGSDASEGLSVLDVDHINNVYNCQGCHRHRWRSGIQMLYNFDYQADLYSFGFETLDGLSLYPCRGRVLGSILAGKYDYRRNSCFVAHNVTLHEIKNDFEVLTIPGGLSNQCSVYKLVSREKARTSNAIPAGDWINDYDWRSFVAYASMNLGNGMFEKGVGTVWVDVGWKEFKNNAELSDGNKGVVAKEYQVLTCSLDTTCVLKKWLADRNDGDASSWTDGLTVLGG